MNALFEVLDRVQESWPGAASFSLVSLAPPPAWCVDAARRVAGGWSRVELLRYRRQLPDAVAYLRVLHRNWSVAAVLAVLLAATIIVAAMPLAPAGAAAGVLAAVLAAVLLPPLVICNGIARDYAAAHALLAVCAAVER